MSKASMVSDFYVFCKAHSAPVLFLTGKQDEFFDWQESRCIFKDREYIEYEVMDDSTHLDIIFKGTRDILTWIQKTSSI
jgi:hypothetical protein